MDYDIYGEAPPSARINVVDAAGETIGNTVANCAGEWTIRTDLRAGTHQLRAVVEGGKSSTLIDVDVSATDSFASALGESDEPLATRLSRQHEIDALRAEAVEQYSELVEAVAGGFEVETCLAEVILANAGKSPSDFAEDVRQLANAEAIERIRDVAFGARMSAMFNQW